MIEKDITVVSSCPDYPGWGGAATSWYKLHQLLLKRGIDSYLYFRNPKGNKFSNNNIWVAEAQSGNLSTLIQKKKPDILIGKNHYGFTEIIKKHYNIPKIFVTSGSKHGYKMAAKNIEYTKWNSFIEKDPAINSAVEIADYIVPHSQMAFDIYSKTFPQYRSKMNYIFEHCLLNQLDKNINKKKKWEDRKIDVLFVASNWKRHPKNGFMMVKLYNILKKYSLNIQCIGKNTGLSKSQDLVSPSELCEILKDTKVLVIPSLIDLAPNVHIEALSCGCNVILSKNVGTYTYNPVNFIRELNTNDFLKGILLALTKQCCVSLPNPNSVLEKFINFLRKLK